MFEKFGLRLTMVVALLTWACGTPSYENDNPGTSSGGETSSSDAGMPGTGGVLGSGGAPEGSGGNTPGAGGDPSLTGAGGDDGLLDTEQEYVQFMRTIVVPLVSVLSALRYQTSDEVLCAVGGTVVIDRDLGEATFANCDLGGITLTGTAVIADGGSMPPEQSAILAGGAFRLGGEAIGELLILLTRLTWQEPPTEATTTWTASFDDGMSGQICVQSSGEPC